MKLVFHSLEELTDLTDALCCDGSAARVVFRLGPIVEQPGGPVAKTPQYHGPKHRFRKRNLIMAATISASQQVKVTVEFRDKKGNPAKVDGKPEWLTDNTDVLALTPGGDGLSCVVAAAGPIGVGIVTLKADADLGSGVVEVVGTLEVNVTAGPATVVTLTAETPEEQP